MSIQGVLARYRRWPTTLLPWLIWGVSSLFVTFQMLLQTAPCVMISDLEHAFSIDALGVSLLSSSFYYTYVLLQIPAGLLVDRVSPRNCLTLCLLGIATMCAVFASTSSLSVATGSRIVQGIFSAPSIVPALYLASVWFPSQRFAFLAGLTEMLGVSGSAIAQVTLAPCASYVGWRNTLWICAGIGLVMAFVTALVVRDKKATEKTPVTVAPKISIWRSFITVTSYSQAWINGLFAGLLFAVSAAFGGFWCIPYLMQTYDVSLSTAAAASSMVLFGVSFGAPVMGWISDRFSVRRLPMIISTAIVMSLMLIILYTPNISLWVMFGLLFGLGFFSGAYALPFAVMRDIMPAEVRGTAMGFTNMLCILIGSPLLQPLIGLFINQQMSHGVIKEIAYHHALTVLPMCLFGALLLTFLVKETYCQQVTPSCG